MEEALKIIKAQFPESQIIPNGEYNGMYLFNVAPKNYNPETDGVLIDGMYSVDLKTNEIKHFYPIFEPGYLEATQKAFIQSIIEK